MRGRSKYRGKFIHFTRLKLLQIVWSFYSPRLPTDEAKKSIYDDTDTTDKCNIPAIDSFASITDKMALLFHENNKFDIPKEKTGIQQSSFLIISSEQCYLQFPTSGYWYMHMWIPSGAGK